MEEATKDKRKGGRPKKGFWIIAGCWK